jgi:hypothetical protein
MLLLVVLWGAFGDEANLQVACCCLPRRRHCSNVVVVVVVVCFAGDRQTGSVAQKNGICNSNKIPVQHLCSAT